MSDCLVDKRPGKRVCRPDDAVAFTLDVFQMTEDIDEEVCQEKNSSNNDQNNDTFGYRDDEHDIHDSSRVTP